MKSRHTGRERKKKYWREKVEKAGTRKLMKSLGDNLKIFKFLQQVTESHWKSIARIVNWSDLHCRLLAAAASRMNWKWEPG